jgi:hypothetical protein
MPSAPVSRLAPRLVAALGGPSESCPTPSKLVYLTLDAATTAAEHFGGRAYYCFGCGHYHLSTLRRRRRGGRSWRASLNPSSKEQ